MKKFLALLTASLVSLALLGVFVLYGNQGARSSDHQDSPVTVSRPGADITDVFVYPSPEHPENVVLAMDVWPLIPTGQGLTKSFDPGVMYQFKISADDTFAPHFVIQFKANGVGTDQQITMYGPGRPNMGGTRSTFIAPAGTMKYNEPATLANGVRAFAGPREDPFYFDLSQFFKIIPDRNYKNQPNPPAPTASCFRKDAQDFLAGFNVLNLTVEVPRKMFADQNGNLPVIHVWATTSVAANDPDADPHSPKNRLEDVVANANSQAPGSSADTNQQYVQIERLGRPAIKEAFEDFKLHDTTNRSDVTDDKTLSDSIKAFMMRPAPAGAGRSEAIANAVAGALIPDAISADLGAFGPARYLGVETNGKSGLPIAVIRAVPPPGIYGIKKALGDPYRHFGGRDLKSPVIDLSLGAIFGSLVPKLGLAPEDNRETPCLTSDNVTPALKHSTDTFPYEGAPQ
ncbi:MAG: DUF4331 domain-containing protein [Candidatus Eremiobacteraeota bacterium]|nr:DUF4331 domain-containing protein [Candidatus Eremiobacteraeota bacterium]